MVQYVRFGLMDNIVLILAGAGIESCIRGVLNTVLKDRIEVRSNKMYMLFIASIGNAVSDWLGGIAAGSTDMAHGTFIGCIVVSLVCIPFVYRRAR